jgi:hypothetical protein
MDQVRCTCGHIKAVHNHNGGPVCSVCGCWGYVQKSLNLSVDMEEEVNTKLAMHSKNMAALARMSKEEMRDIIKKFCALHPEDAYSLIGSVHYE